jgi:hypothetical protein
MGDELTVGAMLYGRCGAHLDAELVGFMRIALADTFDLRRMHMLAAVLGQDAPRQGSTREEKSLPYLNYICDR